MYYFEVFPKTVNSSSPVQVHIKKSVEYDKKLKQLKEGEPRKKKDEEIEEIEELNQEVSMKMTKVLKDTAKSRPELSKAIDSSESRFKTTKPKYLVACFLTCLFCLSAIGFYGLDIYTDVDFRKGFKK